MSPKVDQCCCGCSLKTGAIFIGLYHMIISTSVLITTSVMLYRMCTPTQKFHQPLNETSDPGGGGGRDDKKRKHELLEGGLQAFCIFVITIFSFNFIINCLLIIGVKKEKPLLINVWIIVNSVFLMTSIVVLVISMFMTFLDPDPPLLSMGLSVFSIATTIYFLMVVNSLYHKMDHRHVKRRNGRPPPVVFIIDPTPPPPENDQPPPYPSVSHLETPVVPCSPSRSEVATSSH